MGSNDNQNNDDKNGQDDNKVVEFKVRPKTPPKQPAPQQPPSNNEQLINLPPFTKYMVAAMLGIFIITNYLLNEDQQLWTMVHLGFMPGRFTGTALFEPLALITPFTSMLLHGGWLHIGMNAVMLLAFGTGVERWLGGKKMIAFFVACALFGVAAHFVFNFHSIIPMIGASGGISGLFAAALVMLNKSNRGMTGRFGLIPIIAIWIAISVIFGFVDSPGVDSGDIAWAAHVGGFLGGFAVLKLMKIL